jgi:hypothetical protein
MPSPMKGLFQISNAILVVASLLMAWCLIIIPSSQAADSDPELVPEPKVIENHVFNEPGIQNNVQTYFNNEKWSLKISHGDMNILLMARNITQHSDTWVDYTFNIEYNIGQKLYIAQFMMDQLVFKIGGQEISAPLKTCQHFELTYSPIQYNGTVPSLYCNITYERIQIYSDDSKSSTVDLTLCHHIKANWNQTDIKVEALLDFSNTRFINPSSGIELDAGEPFTAEIQYRMMVIDNEKMVPEGLIAPTGHTNATLEYNLTLDNGSPLTMSKLNMSNDFSVFNGTGAYDSLGYSSMVDGPQTQVKHGFPGLIYKDTRSIKSDPEITVYHNRVTADQVTGNNDPNGVPLWIPIAVIGAVGAIGLTTIMVKRNKRAQ